MPLIYQINTSLVHFLSELNEFVDGKVNSEFDLLGNLVEKRSSQQISAIDSILHGGFNGCSAAHWVNLPTPNAIIWLDKVWNTLMNGGCVRYVLMNLMALKRREMAEDELTQRYIEKIQNRMGVFDKEKSIFHQYHLKYDSILENVNQKKYSHSQLRKMLAELDDIKFCLDLFAEKKDLDVYQMDLPKIKEIIKLISEKIEDDKELKVFHS